MFLSLRLEGPFTQKCSWDDWSPTIVENLRMQKLPWKAEDKRGKGGDDVFRVTTVECIKIENDTNPGRIFEKIYNVLERKKVHPLRISIIANSNRWLGSTDGANRWAIAWRYFISLFALFYGFHKFIVSLQKCTFYSALCPFHCQWARVKRALKSDYWSWVMSTITVC